MYRLSIIILLLATAWNTQAQIGGNSVYEFLNLSASPRVTALGGHVLAIADDDVALAYAMPAALNPSMHGQMTFGTQFYFAGTGITHGYAGYGHYLEKSKLTLHGGVQFMSYGSFDGYDIYEQSTGSFKASEFAITGGVGRQINEKLSAGANIKFITSQLESYSSLGLTADIAMMYKDTAKNLSVGLVMKNAGTQLTTYDGVREPLPFEIQAAFAKKLKYLPLRISVIGTNLQRWNILYDDPNQAVDNTLFGNDDQERTNAQIFVDNFFRHVVVNAEFLFGKKENFRLRVGYNHLRRAELSVDDFRGLAGFSAGIGFKIKRFRFDYGLANYHLAGSTHHLGISTSLGQFGVGGY